MGASIRRLSVCVFLLASGCAAEEPCDPPPAHWPKSAPADVHIIVVDRHDRVFWNGALISRERLRNPLNRADADGRAVQLAPAPGARCAMIETIRLAMERSLDCPSGRCAEAAPAQ